MSMLDSAMKIAIESAGFKIQSETTTTNKNDKLAQQYDKERNSLIEKLNKLNKPKLSYEETLLKTSLEKQLKEIDKKIRKNSTTFEKISFQKDDPPIVKAAIEKFGADSPEVEQARRNAIDLEFQQRQYINKVDEAYVRDMTSILTKGFVELPELNSFIDSSFGKVKDTFIKFYDKLIDESKQSQVTLDSYLDKVATEINKSQFDVDSALEAAVLQADKSKDTLLGVLEGVNQSAEKKAMFEFDLLSKKIDDQIETQASMFGLPPTSSAVQVQKAKKKSDALALTLLDLEEDKLKYTLGIASEAEAMKKQISLDKIDFADKFGSERLALARDRFGLSLDFEKLRLDAASKAADFMVGQEQEKQQIKMSAALEPPSLSAFSSIPSIQARLNESQDNLFRALGFAEKQYDYGKQQQFAEATTKSNSKSTSTPGLGTVAVGIGSTIASMAAGMPPKMPSGKASTQSTSESPSSNQSSWNPAKYTFEY
jgi:hypothetical protein